MDHSNKK